MENMQKQFRSVVVDQLQKQKVNCCKLNIYFNFNIYFYKMCSIDEPSSTTIKKNIGRKRIIKPKLLEIKKQIKKASTDLDTVEENTEVTNSDKSQMNNETIKDLQ